MGRPMKILLIDDETEFTSALAERLKLRGHIAETTDNGETGIDLIQNNDYTIAVLDLMMPGMSGLDTLKHIKQIKKDLPVILLTGHGSTREGVEGMRLGASDYLMKPLDINELLAKINAALNIVIGEQA